MKQEIFQNTASNVDFERAEEDEVSLMERAKIVTNVLDLHWRVLSWWLGLFELADRVLNLNVFRQSQVDVIKVEDSTVTLLAFPIGFHSTLFLLVGRPNIILTLRNCAWGKRWRNTLSLNIVGIKKV